MRRILMTTILLVALGAGGGGLLGFIMVSAVGKRAFLEADPAVVVATTEAKLREQGFRVIHCEYDGTRKSFGSNISSYHVVKCIADGNQKTVQWFNKQEIRSTPPMFLPEREA